MSHCLVLLLEWLSHSIKQSWWMYLMEPLHLHGWINGCESVASPRQIRHECSVSMPMSVDSWKLKCGSVEVFSDLVIYGGNR